MNSAGVALLEKRRNRAIAIVLGVKEREIDTSLSQPQRDRMRKVVLDQFNDYHEAALDVLRTMGDEVTFNQLYLDAVEDIKELLEGMRSSG